MSILRRGLLHAAAGFLLAGCAAQGPFRTVAGTCRIGEPSGEGAGDCDSAQLWTAPASAETGQGYALGVVEFDDQGLAFRPEQAETVFAAIERLQAAGQSLSIVIFVHGWYHNAAPGDGDLAAFSALLAQFARREARVAAARGDQGGGRRVFGIFAAWPGLWSNLPGIGRLSFWERKEAADRVARGDIRALFARARAARDLANWRHRQENRLVIVGHSFGAQIVFAALNQYFIDQLVVTALTGAPVQAYGNLTILINPAFEAVRYDSIRRLVGARSFPPDQLPVLTIFATENDVPVRYFFPAGRALATPFQQLRATDAAQADQIRSGVGYAQGFTTHALTLGEERSCAATGTAAPRLEPGWQRHYPCGAVLTHEAGPPTNPFWLVRTDQRLVDGHSGIWGETANGDRDPWLAFLDRLFQETVIELAPPTRANGSSG